IRDSAGNAIAVCSMENFDPVGIHTGDSIVIAPAVTLADKEYNMLRTAALKIVSTLGVEGGCNIQFAMSADSFEYAVIEVNPRVSRSSALASKATGYPIAKVATKIAIGYTLDEITNAVTGTTSAACEPAVDYVAVKFPKWPFEKFVYANRQLGTQMKATGEVMAIADSFEAALLKAIRGVEIGIDTLYMPRLEKLPDGELWEMLKGATDERVFALMELMWRGATVAQISEATMIDKWFISKIDLILQCEREITDIDELTAELYYKAKRIGYPDQAIERISKRVIPDEFKSKFKPIYKTVDTCAGEFAASTPYFYASRDLPEAGGEDEAGEFIRRSQCKETVLVLGSGPIRIGQGVEFDYASVHCVKSLQRLGYEVAIINNNPETVSTDFDTADRLYFEPLFPEDVMNIINLEKPIGVVTAFGGGTAIRLAKTLHDNNIPIIGSGYDCIDTASDKERFDKLVESLGIRRPAGLTVQTCGEALSAANELGYPVLMRPSYVLGGQNMIIAYDDADIEEYMEIILRTKVESPVLIDKYISGLELEVDAICDGEDILIPGIMEHIERTGVHSGDSIAVYPAQNIRDDFVDVVIDATRRLCAGLGAIGLINMQYIVCNGELYVIEVNPRASRTVPYISKVTGIPMCDIATKVSLGYKLKDMGFGTGLYKKSDYVAVKVPVFSFEKLDNVDTQLGPEMKSTGEALGIGKTLDEALYKGLVAAGSKMCKTGGVFLTVSHSDREEVAALARKFDEMGFDLYATRGTGRMLEDEGMQVTVVPKIHQNEKTNTLTLLQSGKLSYIVSTSAKGRNPERDGVKIRCQASMLGIPCLTSIDTANAMADSLMSKWDGQNTSIIDINEAFPKTE
ncbi:MAG: carbamoyl-phosphate synthase large subunit, partial [Oscillospiraceae bacterium]|nr:carbamoyl-phosphate synthase large subunit [Oscillospiraceae bacterium]